MPTFLDEVIHLIDADEAVRSDKAEGVGADGNGDAHIISLYAG